MNRKLFFSSLMTLFLFFQGCTARTPDTTGNTPGTGTGSPPPGDPGTQAPPDTNPPEADPPPTHDWTAGIVDKPSPEGLIAILASVREAAHGEFDRVVFEFDGVVPIDPAAAATAGSLPGYHIEYIDRPVRQCGSGEVVSVAGDAWLEIRFIPAQAHTEAGEPTVTDRDRQPGLPIVKQIVSTCDYEAHVTWVLGVSSPNHFRVYELADPSRLVIDVRH